MHPALSQFISFVNSRVAISADVEQDIVDRCAIIEEKRGHHLLMEGKVARYLYYIAEGSVRTYYYHKDKDVTSWIYNEDQTVSAFGSLYSGSPSFENIQCTEDSTLVRISLDSLKELYSTHPKMQEFGRVLNEEMISYLDNFYKGFMFMTAKEKYDLLVGVFPDVTLRVNLGYIASLLGISQETLSRIRKK